MRLLIGPPGSGKTHRILEQVRAHLRAGASDFRLIVPTATMAEHLRNQIAREGFVFQPSLVLTLSRLVDSLAPDPPEPPAGSLLLLVREALARRRPKSFQDVAEFGGFSAALAGLIEEFSAAGCDARRLSQLQPGGPYDEAFLEVYREVEAELSRRGWALRGARLGRAVARINQEGLIGLRPLFLDGFFSFTDPELDFIQALGRHADLTLTLPPWPGSEAARVRLLASGFAEERLAGVRAEPQRVIFTAPSLDREAGEIARRILEQAAAGRLFREMGVVVRSADAYVPALRLAFERFGIPARFYFAGPLADHSLVRYLARIIDALLGGWDYEETLSLFRMTASGLGGTAAGDGFDFAVRTEMPGQGLEGLLRIARAKQLPEVAQFLDALRPLGAWPSATAAPSDWARRLGGLRALFATPRIAFPFSSQLVHVWRGQAAALDAFKESLAATAGALGDEAAVSLADFWREAKAALREARLRVADRRRNVVHVLDAYEARQWELPVVFVCGLLEKQFPIYHPQNPLFPDDARRHLGAAGVRLAASADRQAEERFLFHIAATRATSLLALSYPQFNGKGEENLPSFFLDGYAARPEPSLPVRPRSPRPRASLRQVRIYGGQLRGVLSPSSIESFLQCPFQFFGRYTLRLEAPPVRPRERLDPLLQGSIMHEVVARWRPGMDPEPLFAGAFTRACGENNLPDHHETEAVRLRMLAELRRFARQMPGCQGREVHTEERFELLLEDDIRVRGRIDRYELDAEGRAVVIDFKYSRGDRLLENVRRDEEGARVQGGLYLAAIRECFGHEPAAMYYWSLRGDAGVRGWDTPADLGRVAEVARHATIESARKIREGVIAPLPFDRAKCEYCEFRDGCRVETTALVRAAGEAPEWD